MANWHENFLLGDWRVSPKLSRVSKDGQSISVKNKSMAVLVCLADAGGELLTRDEIMDSVWPGMEVTDDVLTQSIVELRKALDDDAKHPRIIETIPRVGFRLLTTVETDAVETGTHPSQPRLRLAIVLIALSIIVWVIAEWRSDNRHPVITVNDPPSIAVLPFANLSDDEENQYFSEGISDDIRNLLGRIPGLKVIGRTSSQAIKGEIDDLRVIGSRLGVVWLLEGSVQRVGDRVRINIQLVDAADGTQAWSNGYDQELTDIFAVQDSVAADVIGALQTHVGPAPTRGRPTESLEAYTLFLKARAAFYALDLKKAESQLFQALEKDADFAEAYELLAYLYWATGGVAQTAVETQTLVKEFTGKAIAIDPRLLFADVFYQVSTIGFDYQIGMIELLEAAIPQQANNPWLLESLIWVLQETGYVEESLALTEHFLRVDPLSPFARAYNVGALYALGRTDEALARIDLRNQSNVRIDLYQLTVLGILLAENEDELATETLTSWALGREQFGQEWFRQLAEGARDPVSGPAFLDKRIEELIAALPAEEAFSWQQSLPALYLFFGHLDRYFELILTSEPTDETWHQAANFVWQGTIFRRAGFTAHPEYSGVVHSLGINRVWDRRGPPDFCGRIDDQWICE